MERAEYGKKILSTVSTKLVANYGNPFVIGLERRKLLPNVALNKKIDYFIKNDDL